MTPHLKRRRCSRLTSEAGLPWGVVDNLLHRMNSILILRGQYGARVLGRQLQQARRTYCFLQRDGMLWLTVLPESPCGPPTPGASPTNAPEAITRSRGAVARATCRNEVACCAVISCSRWPPGPGSPSTSTFDRLSPTSPWPPSSSESTASGWKGGGEPRGLGLVMVPLGR